MRLFAPLYERVLGWARHRRAPAYLSGLSFAEATFFPVPPDVMLIPMVLGRRERGFHYAALCTAASVLGGVFGYLIGAFAFQWLEPWLHRAGYWDAFQGARSSFDRWGFWFILMAGFSPIPYKIFTIAAGAAGMALPLFVVASFVGRGGRFFLVALIVSWAGPKVEPHLKPYMDRIGWSLLAIVVAALLAYRFA